MRQGNTQSTTYPQMRSKSTHRAPHPSSSQRMVSGSKHPLKVATDCSGIDTVIHALHKMGVKHKQLWYCDILKEALSVTINNGGAPEVVHTDIMTRNNSALPQPDVYVVGPPCQPFSTLGSKQHSNDARFNVFLRAIDTISACTPKCCIIENVPSMDEKSLTMIRESLEPLQKHYFVEDRVLNSKHFGLPQNRPRLYIVLVRKDVMVRPFEWPTPMLPVPSLVKFLKLRRGGACEELTPYVQSVIEASAQRVGVHQFHKKPFVCNSGGSKTRLSIMDDMCICLTRRCRPYVSGGYNRRLTTDECAQVQGFEDLDLSTVSPSMARSLIGNAQSVNVLVAILQQLLPCAGLMCVGSDSNNQYTGLLFRDSRS